MTARSPSAFMLSATFHGAVIAAIVAWTYATSQRATERPPIFQVVAGAGNNFSATEAPALGKSNGSTTERSMADAIKQKLRAAENRAKKAVAKERAEEEKALAQQLAAEKTAALKSSTKSPEPAVTPTKSPAGGESSKKNFTPIDSKGIAKGVVGGSVNNTTGGAGGRDLVANNGEALDRYYAMLKEKLTQAVGKQAGLSDTLEVQVEFRINANGSLSGVRILKRSGSAEFDQNVLAAFRQVTDMPPIPGGKPETRVMVFRTRDT
jgi:TonB family protein